MNIYSEKYFNEKSIFYKIDGYVNKKKSSSIIPWHSDRAYSGKNNVENFLHPKNCCLKTFLYLTDVSENNGCMSYIPKTHKINFFIRDGIFKKKIKYSPYQSLNQLVRFLRNEENLNYVNDCLGEKTTVEKFLDISSTLKEDDISIYDYKANADDAIIFDEGGVHRRSFPTLNDRMVVRYFTLPKNFN